jgi:hypothetical protein
MIRRDAHTLRKPGTRPHKTRRRGPNRGESSELRLTPVHNFSTSTRRATTANAVDDFRRFLDPCLPIRAPRPPPKLRPLNRWSPYLGGKAEALKRRPTSFPIRPSHSRPSLSPPLFFVSSPVKRAYILRFLTPRVSLSHFNKRGIHHLIEGVLVIHDRGHLLILLLCTCENAIPPVSDVPVLRLRLFYLLPVRPRSLRLPYPYFLPSACPNILHLLGWTTIFDQERTMLPEHYAARWPDHFHIPWGTHVLRSHPLTKPIPDGGPGRSALLPRNPCLLKPNTFKHADLLHVFVHLPVCRRSICHIHPTEEHATGGSSSPPVFTSYSQVSPFSGPQDFVKSTSPSVLPSFVISDGHPLSAPSYLPQLPPSTSSP